MLDQISDPHNVGAILRTAAAFAVRAVVIAERRTAPLGGTVAKAASGALDLVPVVEVVNLARALDDLAALGYWRIALDGHAEQSIDAAPDAANLVLVLGAEGEGVRRLVREHCDFAARLPIAPDHGEPERLGRLRHRALCAERAPHAGRSGCWLMGQPGSTYREQPPVAALADHVLCVWSQEIGDGDTAYRQRVLPDGCADLVWIGEAPAVVAGPATRPLTVSLAPRTVVVGVRLRPGAAAAVLGPPACALLDRDTPLRDIWSRTFRPDRIAEQRSIQAKLAAVQAALAARLVDRAPPDRGLAAAIGWLARHPAGRIEELARFVEIAPRRLHRRFVAAVGYGPKTLQRVLRLQRALALAARDRRPGLAMLAAEAGYADQPHMSRELRALTGLAPRHLLDGAQSTLALSDLFKTEAARIS